MSNSCLLGANRNGFVQGESKTSIRLTPQRPEIGASSMSHLVRKEHNFNLYHVHLTLTVGML